MFGLSRSAKLWCAVSTRIERRYRFGPARQLPVPTAELGKIAAVAALGAVGAIAEATSPQAVLVAAAVAAAAATTAVLLVPDVRRFRPATNQE